MSRFFNAYDRKVATTRGELWTLERAIDAIESVATDR